MIVPVEVGDFVKLRVATNGTKLVFIQSPWALAGTFPSSRPFASRIFTGNDPSKYQFPLAIPFITRGLVTVAFGIGVETFIRSSCGLVDGVLTMGHSVNSHFGPVRPTLDPSGHILASIVQPAWPVFNAKFPFW